MRIFGRHIKFFRIIRRPEWPDQTLLVEISAWGQIRITKEAAEGLSGTRASWPVERWPKGFTKAIKDGEIIPFWYGFAYYDFDTDCGTYAPIPINLVIAGWEWLKWKIMFPFKFSLVYRGASKNRAVFELEACISRTNIVDHPVGEQALARILIDLGYRRVYHK